uniref:Beta-defensin 135 n=1 Tax=Garrulax canorus TaxID=238855 RepID=A0A3G1AZE6_9PASS|nr:beta-defensin 135 [Garrulax canorus]
MKILFLLFPLILLMVQGAAGSAANCWRLGGICSREFCPRGTSPKGRCAPGTLCCRR